MNLTKLTERDKKLLYIIGCFLILAVGFMYVIDPQTKAISAAEQNLENEKVLKAEMEQSIAESNFNKERKLQLRLEAKLLAKEYYKPMRLEELDEKITAIVQSSGMVPESLTMTEFVDTKLSEYSPGQASEAATVQQGQEGGSNPTGGSSNAVESQSSSLKSSAITLSFNGNKYMFLRLIDMFSGNKSIMVKNFSISDGEKEINPEAGMGDVGNLTPTQGSNITLPSDEGMNTVPASGGAAVKIGESYNINIDVFAYKKNKSQ